MRYLSLLSVIFLSFIVIPNCAQAQKKLAIVGSSTSACMGATVTDSCYVGRLRTYYNQSDPKDTIIDNGFAVGGYTVFRGMPSSFVPNSTDTNRFPDKQHNITAALATHPDVVLINYPTNGYVTVPIDSIMLCFRMIRDSAKKAGVPCFITTTQPRTSGNYNTSAVKLKLAIVKDSILNAFGSFAIDFYTGLINPADSSIRYDAGDQTHMNNTGHDSLAQRVIRANVFLATLPATFLNFNTINKDSRNIVSWLTAQESNISYYEIQRSADGTGFSKIGAVNANNSTGNNQYQYIDEQPLKGNNYYRILIIDKDGKKHASPSMKVYINTGRLAVVKSFVNTSSHVVVELNNKEAQNAEFQVVNNMGSIISKEKRKIEAGSSTVYLTTPILSSGVYHVRVVATGISIVSSFIKN